MKCIEGRKLLFPKPILYFKPDSGRHAGNLVLVFVSDEEGGLGHGARYLVDSGQLPAADACLVAEPNGVKEEDFEFLPLFCRGTFYFKIKVRGTQMHASISDLVPGVNASVKMAWVLWRMARDLRLSYTPHPLCSQGPTVTPGGNGQRRGLLWRPSRLRRVQHRRAASARHVAGFGPGLLPLAHAPNEWISLESVAQAAQIYALAAADYLG